MRYLLLSVALAGCNQLYGLDETSIRPPPDAPPPDQDGDGVSDPADNCPGVANAMQTDADDDGFGDLCDLCPGLETTFNHDEDADSRGDECDVCPTDPDFQLDSDGDKVGDSCDNDFATQNRLLLFDPFVELGPVWDQVGNWAMHGDAVGSATGKLETSTLRIDGTQSYEVRVGVTFTAPLGIGDAGLRVELRDDQDVVVAGCELICDVPRCSVLQSPAQVRDTFVLPQKPVGTLILRKNPYSQVCLFAEAVANDEDNPPPAFPSARVVLVGSPKVQFRHVVVWQ